MSEHALPAREWEGELDHFYEPAREAGVAAVQAASGNVYLFPESDAFEASLAPREQAEQALYKDLLDLQHRRGSMEPVGSTKPRSLHTKNLRYIKLPCASTGFLTIDLATVLQSSTVTGSVKTVAHEIIAEKFDRPLKMFLTYRRHISPPELVADLAQDTLLKVITGLDRFEPRHIDSFTNWVWQIASNTSIDHSRKPTTKASLKEVPLEASEHAAVDEELYDHHAHNLQAAMAKLNDRQRAVMLLSNVGYNVPEAAEILGISASAVHGLKNRAGNVLRQILAENYT